MNHLRLALCWLGAVLCLVVASPAVAQDDGTMTFGEEEAEEVDDDEGDSSSSEGGGEEDGTMTFGEEESDETLQKEDVPLIGYVAVPSDSLDDSQRQELQGKLTEALRDIPDIELEMGPGVLNALQERTVATCVTEPLCLGSVGEKAGVDQLLLAMVDEGPRGMELEINLFNVQDRLFMQSETVKRLGNFNQVLDEVPSTVREVFGIRKERTEEEYAEQNRSLAQTVTAVGCGVLSGGALVGGILFGQQAADIESNLNRDLSEGNSEVHSIDQTEAQSRYEDAQGKAATANIFYGLSGAFAVASTVLFIIEPGGDVADDRRANLLERIDVSPNFGKSGAGVSASFEF